MTVTRYAIVDNISNEVTSVCLWDPETAPDWEKPLGTYVLQCPEEISPGWSYLVDTEEWQRPTPANAIPENIRDTELDAANAKALTQLMAFGIDEATARIILRMPPA